MPETVKICQAVARVRSILVSHIHQLLNNSFVGMLVSCITYFQLSIVQLCVSD